MCHLGSDSIGRDRHHDIDHFILATISGKSGLRQQAIVHDTLGADGPADFRSILKLVFIFTLSVEFTGTLVLWIRFLFELEPIDAAWHALFHSSLRSATQASL